MCQLALHLHLHAITIWSPICLFPTYLDLSTVIASVHVAITLNNQSSHTSMFAYFLIYFKLWSHCLADSGSK